MSTSREIFAQSLAASGRVQLGTATSPIQFDWPAAVITIDNTNGASLLAFIETSDDIVTQTNPTWFDAIGFRKADGTPDTNGSTGFSVPDGGKRSWIVPLYGARAVSLRAGNGMTGTASVTIRATTQLECVPPSLSSLGTLTLSGKLTAQQLNVSPAPLDTYSATMTIDVTKGLHVIAASSTTSATTTLTPSAAGSKGDMLTILTEADSSGTVTATFASTFHSSGTQATTASHFSSITFQSDGTRWVELCRTTALS